MKGKNFLLVVGILLIVFGGIGVFSSLLYAVFVPVMNDVYLEIQSELANSSELTPAMAGFVSGFANVYSAPALIYMGIWSFIASVLELVSGIFGIKYCNKGEKAGFCFKLGWAMIAVIVVGNIIYSVITTPVFLVNIVFGIILPVLYIVGAVKNKNSFVQ